MTFQPTPEQQAIIDAAVSGTASIMVKAYAGCTKTSTLEMLAAKIKPQPALAIAFNKKIAVELEKRLPSFFSVKTMNGLGHAAWAKALGGRRLQLEERKVAKLTTELLKESGFASTEEQWSEIYSWVNKARQAGIIPREYEDKGYEGLKVDTAENWDNISDAAAPDKDLREFAQEVLRRSVKQGFEGIIDFDDQIYMSCLFRGVYPQFPLVLVDEAQDLSPLNHLQVQKASAGRLIVVGDPKQAIYAFRGADSQSMWKLRGLRKEWIDLPLTITFRCSKVVVARNLHHAPGFQAWPTNAEGEELRWARGPAGPDQQQLEHRGEKAEGWSWKWLDALRPHPGAQIAVVCRNTAPLLGFAFKLIRQGVPPQMLGRDIGKGLVTLSRKIAPKDSTPRAELWEKIDKWQRDETAKARENDKEHLVSGIEDRAECLRAVADADGVDTAGALRIALEKLFAREFGAVTLGTGHRVKGLEYDVVVHLDPWRLPSKYARKAEAAGDSSQMEQENNLRYVIETRTRNIFVEANLEDFI